MLIQVSLNKNKIHLRPVRIGLMRILFFCLFFFLFFFFWILTVTVTVILFQNETG